jgi:dihydroneopterin aldolase
MALDYIFIKLKIMCSIGILPEEKNKKQTVMIHLKLYKDLYKAGKSDNIQNTIDYVDVCNKIKEISLKKHYGLIEALGEAIITELLNTYAINKIKLIIEKIDALKKINGIAKICLKRKISSANLI